MKKDKVIQFLNGDIHLNELKKSLDLKSYKQSISNRGSFIFQASTENFYFSNKNLMILIHNFVLKKISIDELSYLMDYIDLQEEVWEYENKSFVEEFSLICNNSPR